LLHGITTGGMMDPYNDVLQTTTPIGRTTRRTALRGLTAGSLAAGLFGSLRLRRVAAAPTVQENTLSAAPSWRLAGDAMEACRCAVTCPCNFGSDPTDLPCGAIIGWTIHDGQYGETQLDDLNVVAILQIPGNAFKGGWTLGFYFDERAEPAQADALEAIFSGQAGGWPAVLGPLVATPLPPKQVPIEIAFVDDNVRVSVPELLEVATERVPNPLPGAPPLDLKVSNLAVPFYTGTVDVRQSTTLKLTDSNLSFEYPGRSSLIGKFEYSGP
jgi:hypothetical protein